MYCPGSCTHYTFDPQNALDIHATACVDQRRLSCSLPCARSEHPSRGPHHVNNVNINNIPRMKCKGQARPYAKRMHSAEGRI